MNIPSIEKFYENNSVLEDFDEIFYRNEVPETKEFYQPYCTNNNIDDKHRLYYHYYHYGQNSYINLKEKTKHIHGISDDEIILLNNIQLKNTNLFEPSIILVNHDSSLTGAPIFLVDIANWLSDNNFKNVIFVDAFPNKLFKINESITVLHHFNDAVILKNIIDNTIPILIYANSLNPIVRNPELFSDTLYKTVFHLHESFVDLLSYVGDYSRYNYILNSSRNIVLVADDIVSEYNLVNVDKTKLSSPFIPQDKIELINSNIKNKRYSEKITICMCGSVCDRKNPQLFIHLAKMNPNYEFIWIGGHLGIDLPNLKHIGRTDNPYEIFSQIDYFFLTSLNDPCPIVVLENLLMNNKIIFLENNIKYKHDVSKLENVLVISNHGNDFNTIDSEFKKLNINKQPNATNKNVEYIKNYFSKYIIKNVRPTKHKTHLIFSFYNRPDEDINYYVNSINQQILLDKNIESIKISIASDKDDISEFFSNKINHDNILISQRNNAGWDIGGLINCINDSSYNDSDYLIYIHNKSNLIWRKNLYKILYCNDYFKYNSVVSKRHYIECDAEDKNRQLFKIHKFMENAYDESFNYISGTCFITKYNILRELINNYEYIINNLTNIDTDDIFWQKQMSDEEVFEKYYKIYADSPMSSRMDKDSRDVFLSTKSKNYFELYIKYKKRGISDCTFEHALERYIGYLLYKNHKVLLV